MPTLVVQLGHCYRRTGATGTTGEQEYAARVGDACRALLHGRGGWSVRLILADDPAASYAGDAFFAIHCDGSTSPAARGASVGYRTPEGQAAAQSWKRAYAGRGWPGFRPDNYTQALAQYYGTGTAVSRGNRRAVILECGFRTNAEDKALLDAPGGPERVALSIADALGIPVDPGTKPPKEPPLRKDMIVNPRELRAGTRVQVTLLVPDSKASLIVYPAHSQLTIHELKFVGPTGGAGVDWVGDQWMEGENPDGWKIDAGRPLEINLPGTGRDRTRAIEMVYTWTDNDHECVAGFRHE